MQFFGYRQTPAAVTAESGISEADMQAAYERGRRDERRRRHRHPILALTTGAVAVVGAAVLMLAAREGSFAAGGQAIDRNLAAVASQAQIAGHEAAESAGSNLRQSVSAHR